MEAEEKLAHPLSPCPMYHRWVQCGMEPPTTFFFYVGYPYTNNLLESFILHPIHFIHFRILCMRKWEGGWGKRGGRVKEKWGRCQPVWMAEKAKIGWGPVRHSVERVIWMLRIKVWSLIEQQVFLNHFIVFSSLTHPSLPILNIHETVLYTHTRKFFLA